jgi:hypothetical protein
MRRRIGLLVSLKFCTSPDHFPHKMAKKLKLDDTLLKADVGDDELANPKGV